MSKYVTGLGTVALLAGALCLAGYPVAAQDAGQEGRLADPDRQAQLQVGDELPAEACQTDLLRVGGEPERAQLGELLGEEIVVIHLLNADTVLESAQGAAAPEAALDAEARAWEADPEKWMPLPDIFPEGAEFQVIHGDPARGPSDMYFHFPAGYGVPKHFHTPQERVFVDKGTMRFETFDGESITIGEGGSISFPARAPHSATCVSDEDCYFYLVSSAPFDIHLIDEDGRTTESWYAGEQPQTAAVQRLDAITGAHQRFGKQQADARPADEVRWIGIVSAPPASPAGQQWAQLSAEEQAEHVERFARQHGLEYPLYLDEQGTLAAGFALPDAPHHHVAIVDDEGRLVFSAHGDQLMAPDPAGIEKSYLIEAIEQVLADEEVSRPHGATTVPAGLPRPVEVPEREGNH